MSATYGIQYRYTTARAGNAAHGGVADDPGTEVADLTVAPGSWAGGESSALWSPNQERASPESSYAVNHICTSVRGIRMMACIQCISASKGKRERMHIPLIVPERERLYPPPHENNAKFLPRQCERIGALL